MGNKNRVNAGSRHIEARRELQEYASRINAGSKQAILAWRTAVSRGIQEEWEALEEKGWESKGVWRMLLPSCQSSRYQWNHMKAKVAIVTCVLDPHPHSKSTSGRIMLERDRIYVLYWL